MYIPHKLIVKENISPLSLGQIEGKLYEFKDARIQKDYKKSDQIKEELMNISPVGRFAFLWDFDYTDNPIPSRMTTAEHFRIDDKKPLELRISKDGEVEFFGEIVESRQGKLITTDFYYKTK